jgi:hypothetical protein
MSKVYTREDINSMAMTELTQLTTAGGGIHERDDCSATIDGGPGTAPLWSISAADIESVEIYPPGSLLLGDASALRSRPRTSINSNRSIAAQGRGRGGTTECPVQVFVWLRK